MGVKQGSELEIEFALTGRKLNVKGTLRDGIENGVKANEIIHILVPPVAKNSFKLSASSA